MKRSILVFVMIAAAIAMTWAETSLTPEAAVQLAIKNNLSLQRTRLSAEALKRASDRSWNSALPSLGLSSGTTRSGSSEKWSVYGSVSASVTLSTSIISDIKKAQLNYEAGLLSYQDASRSLELNVRKAFYSLLLEQENIDLTKQNIATAEKQYAQTKANFKAGLVPELDVLSAQVTLENLKPTLASSEVSYENDLEAFKQLLGISLGDTITLSGSLEEASSLSSIDSEAAKGEAPDVAALKKSLEIAQTQKKATDDSAHLPSLSLSYSLKPTYSSSDWTDQGAFSAVLSLSLDGFLPWSSTKESMDEAADTVKSLENELMEAKVEADLNVRSLLRSIEQALSAVTVLRLNVDLAQKTYNLTEDAYKKGAVDLLSLQDADDSLREAKVEVLKEVYTLISAVLDLEYATGVPFGSLGR